MVGWGAAPHAGPGLRPPIPLPTPGDIVEYGRYDLIAGSG